MSELSHIVNLCDRLVSTGKELDASVNATAIDSTTVTSQFKKAALATIHLKHFNREILQSLDVKKREVETEKEKLEVLKLKSENLLYKRAYLLREIRVLQDLTTPNLQSVEHEIGRRLAVSAAGSSTGDESQVVASSSSSSSSVIQPLECSSVTTANLESVEALARVAMDNEIIEREQDMKTLASLTEEKQAREAILDKKRKFLDDVPIRLAKMQSTYLDDLHKQFETYRKELLGLKDDPDDEVDDEDKEENDGDAIEGAVVDGAIGGDEVGNVGENSGIATTESVTEAGTNMVVDNS